MEIPEDFQKELNAIAEGESAEGDEGQEEYRQANGAEEGDQVEQVEQEYAPDEEVEQEESHDSEEEEVEKTDKGPMVPLSRLKKKSEESQAAIERAIRAEAQLEAFRQQFEQKQPQQQQQEAQEENPYDPEFDEAKYYKWEMERAHAQLAKEVSSLKEKQTVTEKQAQQQQAVAQVGKMVASQIKEAAASEIPDAADAYEYLVEVKTRELAPFCQNQQELDAKLDDYLLRIAVPTLQNGGNTAAIYKKYAENFGYKAKEPEKKRGTDLDAIERNKQKLGNSSSGTSVGLGGGGDDIKSLKRKDGKGVDPDKFHKSLANI